MEKITKKEAVKRVLNLIPADFGKSLNEVIKDIFKQCKREKWGIDSPRLKSPNGYTLWYCDNNNYMQGDKNGGGKGVFATLQGVGMCQNIKISNAKITH